MRYNYLLVFILLVVSGNPFVNLKYSEMGLLIALLASAAFHRTLKRGMVTAVPYILFLLAVFLLQAVVLDSEALLGPLRLIAKVLFGVAVMFILGPKFSQVLFRVVTVIAAISLPIYVFDLFSGGIYHTSIGALFAQDKAVGSIFVYTFLPSFAPNYGRNSGMFWEPGAFAGVLALTMALNHKIAFLPGYRRSLIIIIAALATTMSTTGYVAFAGIVVLHQLLAGGYPVKKAVLLGAFALLGYAAFTKVPFLAQKIERDVARAHKTNKYGVNNTRFGSMMMDWYYIKKHPLIGNGYKPETRWADHPKIIWIMSQQDIGASNGLTNYAACMGVPALIIYFIMIYRRIPDKIVAIPVIVTLIMTIFGEQWLNFSLFLAMPFIKTVKSVGANNGNRNTHHLPQP